MEEDVNNLIVSENFIESTKADIYSPTDAFVNITEPPETVKVSQHNTLCMIPINQLHEPLNFFGSNGCTNIYSNIYSIHNDSITQNFRLDVSDKSMQIENTIKLNNECVDIKCVAHTDITSSNNLNKTNQSALKTISSQSDNIVKANLSTNSQFNACATEKGLENFVDNHNTLLENKEICINSIMDKNTKLFNSQSDCFTNFKSGVTSNYCLEVEKNNLISVIENTERLEKSILSSGTGSTGTSNIVNPKSIDTVKSIQENDKNSEFKLIYADDNKSYNHDSANLSTALQENLMSSKQTFSPLLNGIKNLSKQTELSSENDFIDIPNTIERSSSESIIFHESLLDRDDLLSDSVCEVYANEEVLQAVPKEQLKTNHFYINNCEQTDIFVDRNITESLNTETNNYSRELENTFFKCDYITVSGNQDVYETIPDNQIDGVIYNNIQEDQTDEVIDEDFEENEELDNVQTKLNIEDVSEVIKYMEKADSISDRLSIISILQNTEDAILEKMLCESGWHLLFLWLDESKDSMTDVPYLVQLLRLFQILPVSLPQLKQNPSAKIIKHLIKSQWKEVSTIAKEIVDAWLLKIKMKNAANRDVIVHPEEVSTNHNKINERRKSDEMSNSKNSNKRNNFAVSSDFEGPCLPIKIKVKILPPLEEKLKLKKETSGFMGALKSTEILNQRKKRLELNEVSSKNKTPHAKLSNTSPPVPSLNQISKTMLPSTINDVSINENINYGSSDVLLEGDVPNLRGTKKNLKSVSWASDNKLCVFHYFILDETERTNVSAKPAAFADIRRHEIEMEHRMFQNVRKLTSSPSIPTKDMWYRPHLIEGVPSVVEWGSNSTERLAQSNRECNVLQVIYFSRSLVPDCPQECELEFADVMEIKDIPLSDVTGTGSEVIYDHNPVPTAPLPPPPIPPPPPPHPPEFPDSSFNMQMTPQAYTSPHSFNEVSPMMYPGGFGSPPYINSMMPSNGPTMPIGFFPPVMNNMMDHNLMCMQANSWSAIPPPPPPPAYPATSSKQICTHYKAGTCRFGSSCRFQHISSPNPS